MTILPTKAVLKHFNTLSYHMFNIYQKFIELFFEKVVYVCDILETKLLLWLDMNFYIHFKRRYTTATKDWNVNIYCNQNALLALNLAAKNNLLKNTNNLWFLNLHVVSKNVFSKSSQQIKINISSCYLLICKMCFGIKAIFRARFI